MKIPDKVYELLGKYSFKDLKKYYPLIKKHYPSIKKIVEMYIEGLRKNKLEYVIPSIIVILTTMFGGILLESLAVKIVFGIITLILALIVAKYVAR